MQGLDAILIDGEFRELKRPILRISWNISQAPENMKLSTRGGITTTQPEDIYLDVACVFPPETELWVPVTREYIHHPLKLKKCETTLRELFQEIYDFYHEDVQLQEVESYLTLHKTYDVFNYLADAKRDIRNNITKKRIDLMGEAIQYDGIMHTNGQHILKLKPWIDEK